MQFDPRRLRPQRRPLAHRLLHPVFAEDTLPRRDNRLDDFGREGFGDANERDRARRAPGVRLRPTDAPANVRQPGHSVLI